MYKLGNKRFSYKLVLFAVDVLSSVKAVFIFLIMAVLLCNLESLCMGGSRLSPTEQDADHVTPGAGTLGGCCSCLFWIVLWALWNVLTG